MGIDSGVRPTEAEMQYYNTYCAVAVQTAAIVARVSATIPDEYSTKLELIDRGEKLLDKIAIWSAIPLIGRIVVSRLADRLDRIATALERYA